MQVPAAVAVKVLVTASRLPLVFDYLIQVGPVGSWWGRRWQSCYTALLCTALHCTALPGGAGDNGPAAAGLPAPGETEVAKVKVKAGAR